MGAAIALRALGPALWVHDATWLAMWGVETTLRTTIVKLADGRLWIHSPTLLSAALKAEVDRLGPVGYLVAANNYHHLWLREWHQAYPEAEVFVSAGLPRKLPWLERHAVLEPTGNPPWEGELVGAFMAGVPLFSETIFLHPKSGSLIVTDFVQNYVGQVPRGVVAKLAAPLFALIGFKDRCLAPPLRIELVRKDPRAFAGFLAAIAEWDFQRIIVTHGDVIEHRAKEVLAELCARYRKLA